jgi:hypothetical protein
MTAGLRVGVSGHQARPGIDWAWTADRIRGLLSSRSPVARAFTSLAVGSDQVFAREALALGIPVTAVIPMAGYERCFEPADREAYHALLARCDVLQLDGGGSDEEAFFAAGCRVADSCDLLVAVWDGKPSAGFGGTADIVDYCLKVGRSILHIDPIARETRMLPSGHQSGDQ